MIEAERAQLDKMKSILAKQEVCMGESFQNCS